MYLYLFSILGLWIKVDRRNIVERTPAIRRLKEKLESNATTMIPSIYALCVATCPSQFLDSSSNSDIVNLLLSLKVVPLLVNIVKESVKKAVVANIDGILALRLLVELSSVGEHNLIEQHKLLPAFQSGSFLYSKAILQLYSTTIVSGKGDNKYKKTGEQILKEDVTTIISGTFKQLAAKHPTYIPQIFLPSHTSSKSNMKSATEAESATPVDESSRFLISCVLNCSSENHRKYALADLSALFAHVTVGSALLDALREYVWASALSNEERNREAIANFKTSTEDAPSKPNLKLVPATRLRDLFLAVQFPTIDENTENNLLISLGVGYPTLEQVDNRLLLCLQLSSHPLMSENNLPLARNCLQKALLSLDSHYQAVESSTNGIGLVPTSRDRCAAISLVLYGYATSLQQHLRATAHMMLKLLLPLSVQGTTYYSDLLNTSLIKPFPSHFISFAVEEIPVQNLFSLSPEVSTHSF